MKPPVQPKKVAKKKFNTQLQHEKTLGKIVEAIKVCPVLEKMSEEDEDWCVFIAEVISEMKLSEIPVRSVRIKIEDELSTHMESLQLSPDELSQFYDELVQNLEAAGIVKEAVQAATNNNNTNDRKPSAVGPPGKIRRVFGKELARRRFPLEAGVITDTMLDCSHEWINEISHGDRCLVCDFETTKLRWTCKLNCQTVLCGSCCSKWKDKL